MSKIKQIITGDESITFLNEDIDETYHSKSGAMEESLKKFVKPSDINKSKKIKILDFCFGLGYNSACAIDEFTGEEIEIIALENDEEILNQIQILNPSFKNYDLIKKAVKNAVKDAVKDFQEKKNENESENNKIHSGKQKNQNNADVKIKIIIDDAKESVKNLKDNYFDFIFFDPFSPKKQPELWTLEIFKEIFRVMKPQAILTTYSCASWMRNNMKEAGLDVMDGPIVGRRAPGTIAIKRN